jgi:hypothetical protein
MKPHENIIAKPFSNEKNFKGAYVAIVLGMFLITNAVFCHGDTERFVEGILPLFGGLAYLARKKQKLGASKMWLVAEIPSLILVLLYSSAMFHNDNWYRYPVTYMFIPLWVVVAYFIVAFKRKNKLEVALPDQSRSV